MSADREVAEVLAAHAYAPFAGWACACGEWFGERLDFSRPGTVREQFASLHTAHQAVVLAPLIAKRERAAVEQALRDTVHAWQREAWTAVTPKVKVRSAIGVAQVVTDWLRERADAARGAL